MPILLTDIIPKNILTALRGALNHVQFSSLLLEVAQSDSEEALRPGPDDRGNAIAVCAGLVPAHRRDALVSLLQKIENSSITIEFHAVEALFLLDAPDLAIERLLRRYQAVIAHPNSTVPERFGNTDRDPSMDGLNQGVSAVPAAILARRVAGIRPITPGYKRFHIQPQPAELSHFAVHIPSIRGDIAVTWQDSGTTATLQVLCPPGTMATVIFPPVRKWSSISCTVASITPDAKDPSRFQVGPGEWTFVGK